MSETDSIVVRLAEGRAAARRLYVLAREDGGERELWSSDFPLAVPGERILCGASGAYVLHLLPEPAEGAPPLASYGARGEERRWSRADLHQDPEPRRWLAEGGASARLVRIAQPFGAQELLALETAGGRRIHVEPVSGRVDFDAPQAPAPVACEPAAPQDEALERVYVEASRAPALVLAGQPLRLCIRGSFPTPGWSLAGFRLGAAPSAARPATSAEEERALELVALARPPAGGAQLQVLVPFEAEVLLHGLPAGRYLLRAPSRAEGASAQSRVHVLPASLLVSFHQSGGIAGIDRRALVHTDGWLELGGTRPLREERTPARLSPERAEELARLLSELPPGSIERRTALASDLFVYELVWRAGDELRRALVDDLSDGELREPIRFLRELE